MSPGMKAPEKVEPSSLADYLEVMTKAVFQAGMSWRVVEAKWEGFREAFHGFDPERVANLTPDELEDLTGDSRIIRNRKKILATSDNAQTMLELAGEHGGFRDYLRSHGGFEKTVADLKQQFRFLGETGCYYFLYVVGEDVPPHQEWAKSRGITLPATA